MGSCHIKNRDTSVISEEECLPKSPSLRLHPEVSGVEVAHKPVFFFSNNGVWASFFFSFTETLCMGPSACSLSGFLGYNELPVSFTPRKQLRGQF